jgi:hypothetical protein
MSQCPFLKELWYDLANKPYKKEKENDKLPPLNELRESEWSEEFEQLMRNRLIVGAFRYGLLKDSDRPSYKRVSSIIDRLQLYLQDGNTEHLVDAAAISLAEYVCGDHPLKHFGPNDDHIHMKQMK